MIYLCLLLFLLGCSQKQPETHLFGSKGDTLQTTNVKDAASLTPVYSISVVTTIPHDSTSFTQGLFYYGGYLYESTGQYGSSSLRKIDPNTGKVVRLKKINDEYFAEGIALYKKQIYMLSWQNNTCFVFSLDNFELLKEFEYYGEGWGLTNYNDQLLVQSDGTNALKIIEPEDFKVQSTLLVFDKDTPISNLNELELIDDEIWANIWMKDLIASIDKETGRVNYWIDISPLRKFVTNGENVDVLNGIAFDSVNNRIFLTGKFWKDIFVVSLKKNNNN